MEQTLSFISVNALCMVAMFVIDSQLIFLIFFIGGCSYLVIRGKEKGWSWDKP
jgi:hypothetical protein